MIYLLIAIAAMSLIMLALKFFNAKGIYIPQVILVNYALALVIAVVSGHEMIATANLTTLFNNNWWYLALITGLLYFGSMDIMALSTQRVGVAVTTMASRTSVVMPILWAFLFLNESINAWEIIGTLLVMLAFALIIYRKRDKSTRNSRSTRRETAIAVLLPIGVFLSVGFIAVCMKTSQHLIKNSGNYATDYPIFQTLLFTAALLGAILYYGMTEGKKAFRLNLKSVIGGICLGTFNYFVTFGLMNGLKYFSSSTFYGVYNISVVLLTTLVGVFLFKEKLDNKKIGGMVVAITAIVVLGFFGKSL